ncbi:peptidyl-prolyl cis-trans isomerase C [Actimicrobium sp. GrIS 1.19]|uniref:EpsD family peptidyl-prolyl cis-trans isomerase n=1 Tax=Actimicrobium sp. GrIS 1.19 TaxID=3071708 RepID=UPI002E0BBB9C|nr:peptidyl-prolyl cis-trans isomerase C [Actimicrobium sp. GrIS 1.19]
MHLRTVSALAVLAAVALSGCGKSAGADANSARPVALATVNGIDISLLAPPDPQRLAGSALALADRPKLEALIDSQVLQDEAIRNRLDRDPLVMRAIERAKADILAQAWLQSKASGLAAPTRSEIDAYFAAHPELFARRKLFYIKQLIVDTKDFTPQMKQQIDRARSIEQVAKWLDAHRIPYERAQLSRNSTELAPELIVQLKSMRRHQLFVVAAGARTMVDALQDVTSDPVTAATAAPQIDAFLRNTRRKQADDLEIKRLRALARIAYFNQPQGIAANPLAAPHSTPMEKQ